MMAQAALNTSASAQALAGTEQLEQQQQQQMLSGLAHPITITPSASSASCRTDADWESFHQGAGGGEGTSRGAGGPAARAGSERSQGAGQAEEGGEPGAGAGRAEAQHSSQAPAAGGPGGAGGAARQPLLAPGLAELGSSGGPAAPAQPGPGALLLRLHQLAASRLPLPELDLAEQLLQLPGARWVGSSVSVARRAAVLRAPRVLCLHLQRSGWGADGYPFKYSGHVGFPLRLDLKPFTLAGDEDAAEDLLAQYSSPGAGGGAPPPPAATAACGNASSEYDLAACVVHVSASSGAGHYVVYARRQEGQGRGGIQRRARERWFRVSDHSAAEVELGEVLGCEATLLVYERCAV
jgi:hypothetical protein